MNISIFGTREEVEYEIVLSSKTTGVVPFTTKYIYDDALAKGQQVVQSGGVNGYTSEGYITKKLNGAQVNVSLLSKDTYNAQQQVVRIGTR
ncbi:MAG: G5 domain-containing protein [Clostridia bacterium]